MLGFRRATRLAAIIGCCAAFCAFAAEDTTERAKASGSPSSSAHPRLWLADAGTLGRLVAAAQANTAEWDALKSFCDSETLPTYHYQGDEQYRFIGNFALCYRIVRAISGAAPAAVYAQKAVNILRSTEFPVVGFIEYDTDSGYGIRNYVPAMALAFDWLADSPLMDAQLKGEIDARIRAWLDFYAATGYANDAPISNYNSGYMLARALSAVALYGETTLNPSLWTAATAHYADAIAEFDGAMPGGHWPEGWNYGPGVYERYLMAASALRIFTNDPAFLASSWLAANVIFKMNALTTNGLFFHDDGAWTGSGRGLPENGDMIVAGYAFGWASETGAIVRTYVNRAVAAGRPLGIEEWKVFLFYDPVGTASSLDTLAKSYHARGTGVVTMRSDWTTAQGTWASFVTGPYLSYQGGQDMDQGHVTIYRRAPLLIDVGHDLYGDVGQADTAFHNTYTLEGRVDGSYAGQRDNTSLCPNPLGNNPIGIRRFSDPGTYAFVSGEFSAAYQTASVDPDVDPCARIPVTRLSRSVLFVRPGLFALYDQIQKASDQPNLMPKMNLHFPTQPTVAGEGNRRLTVDAGGGRLHVASVFPITSTSNLQFRSKNLSTGPGVANWHLTVTYPTVGPAYKNFLTVLRAGDAAPAFALPNVTAISGTNAYGSLVTGLTSAESAVPIAMVFADNGTAGVPTSLHYQYTTAAAAHNYVALLKPRTRYTVVASLSGGVETVTITESSTGLMTDAAGVLVFPSPPPSADPPRLSGISTRAAVLAGDGAMIGGFIVGGNAPKNVVVRARGPSLGVAGALADPTLTLVPAAGSPTTNDDWQADSNAPALAVNGFAPADPKESAILAALDPGAYTVIVNGKAGASGVAIVEVFELDGPQLPLVGIATRGQVQTGDSVMIGGFIIQGDAPQTVIVRARGPSLGVAGALADPTLTLVPASGPIVSNDDWGTASNVAAIAASGYAPGNARESAIMATLAPGAYTAVVSGHGGTTGIALVEVYKVE